MAASGAVPNKQLSDPPAPSSRSSNDSGEAESPFTGNPRTPGSISPPTPGIERGTWQFGWRQTGGFIQQFDCDGLTTWVEAGQARLVQIESEYLTRIETLQRQLHLAKLALQHFTMYNGTSPHIVDGKDENGSQAESQESGEHLSLGAASDISWEHVEEKDAKMTLWVPDHAVTHCAGCNQEFWIVRRKHHCRNCGQVYCGDCTRFTSPVPQQQLNNPVRVCRQCYITIQGEDDLVACITNCRHCGEELQADEGLEILTSGRSTPDSDTDKTTTPTCS